MSRIPAAELAVCYLRCAGYCELCGAPLRRDEADEPVCERHHRKNRGSGGKGELDVSTNLMIVHPGCHSVAHLDPQRYELGWMVAADEDPALVAVQVRRGVLPVRRW